MSKRSKAYVFFWLGAFFMQAIALLKLLFEPNTGFEVEIYTVFYNLSQFAFYELLGIIFFVLGAGYWMLHKMKRRVNRSLAISHSLITLGLLSIMGLISAGNHEDMWSGSGVSILMMILLSFILAAQLLYIINIIITLSAPKHRYKRRHRYDSDIED